jgi:hypothetical protein
MLETNAQEAELALFKRKLEGEVCRWNEHKTEKGKYEAESRSEKKELKQMLNQKVEAKTDALCSLFSPVKKLSEDAVLTYVAECLEKFAEENSLSKESVYMCIVARMDALGQKFHSNV